ncbi:uncharacterized protein KY384_008574 [Bacidia gigantensis]|uniref:uncharacterized protein n=1 Tax=Bacidia gigantensis TaxID=2732470 RepID=UPI001D039B2A|nr:uncharacterized protein KY384_008574 [Bacidia gigantensis]KAG8527145.1 hypothetical protein KY384_008574 [Bacidia gigantensis]
MDNEQSDDDKALLARLNAIKPSTASSLSGVRSLPPLQSESEDTPEDLIVRFQKIHGREVNYNGTSFKSEDSPKNDRPTSPTIEELLAELGPEEQFQIDETEMREARGLLDEAKAVLPAQGASTAPSAEIQVSTGRPDPTEERSNEDEEAASALQRILDESERDVDEHTSLSQVTQQEERPPPEPTAVDSFAALQFPTVPPDNTLGDLNLPSVPTNAPGATSKVRPAAATEEEIESWCIICCANATVQCFGTTIAPLSGKRAEFIRFEQ